MAALEFRLAETVGGQGEAGMESKEGTAPSPWSAMCTTSAFCNPIQASRTAHCWSCIADIIEMRTLR